MSGNVSLKPWVETGMNKRNKIFTAVVLTGIVVGTAAGCRPTTPAVTHTVPGPTVTRTVPGPSTAPVLSEAAWATRYGVPVTGLLGGDLSRLQTDAGNQDVTALTTDAGKLSSDVQVAQGDPPPPVDPADWNRSLADENVAAADIQTGDYTDAITELGDADTALANVTAATNS